MEAGWVVLGVLGHTADELQEGGMTVCLKVRGRKRKTEEGEEKRQRRKERQSKEVL